MVTTLFQHCISVLREKSSLRIVPCKITLKLPETSKLHVLWRKCRSRVLLTFFSLPLIFTLVAASISHFLTAATKFLCCSSNQKNAYFAFFALSNSLSLFFSLSFAGLSPIFSFSPCFSFSIFHINCGLDNQSKLNTLDNTDTETISAFCFRLH